MPSFSKHEVLLVHYPFTDLKTTKVRPAVVFQAFHPNVDILLVPLTSRVSGLRIGEFILSDWSGAGLHVPTAVKRGIYTIHPSLVVKKLGLLSPADQQPLENALRCWLGL